MRSANIEKFRKIITLLYTMFTGIIESLGTVEEITAQARENHLQIRRICGPELKIDQSVSHNRVCLTVEKVSGNTYQVTAIKETLDKTNLSMWKTGRQSKPGKMYGAERPAGWPYSAGPC